MFDRSLFIDRRMLALALCAVTIASSTHAAGDGLAGRYRIQGGPDVASELILGADGKFQYFLMAGALDEQAEGSWQATGDALRLTTIPKPTPAVFSPGPTSTAPESKLAVRVTNPSGRGLPLVDVKIGFETGAPATGYTQDYGWSLDQDELRTPRWIELSVPIYNLRSQRFPINLAKGNALTFVLTPNDLGTIDFTGMQIDIQPGRLIMHRGGALIAFKRAGANGD
jgi:hypothetical protein